jgi:purine nucleosidase
VTDTTTTSTVAQRMRVIIDNDFSGDPDGLFQLAHHALSPSVDIRAVIGSHLRPGDPFDSSEVSADNAAAKAREILELAGRTDIRVLAGSNVALVSRTTPIHSDAALAIVAEAMRDDVDGPVYVCCGAGLTEIASAWLIEPRIAERVIVVWIGGREHDGMAIAPPGAPELEYNLAIDLRAGQVVWGDSGIPIWQIPRNAYRQALMSTAEIDERVAPAGPLGAALAQSIAGVMRMAAAHGRELGEIYVMGDSPLVLLTALQSSFEPDPSSSEYVLVATPSFDDEGAYVANSSGRPMRAYSRLDVRLMFEDFYLKLARHARKSSQI